MAKAVIFDLFETLITEWGHEKYTKRMMAEDLGIPYEDFEPRWEALHEVQYRGELSCEDAIRQVCREAGREVTDETVRYVLHRRTSTKAACFDFLHPQIIPMLTALRECGYRLAILSNCSGEEVTVARGNRLAGLVDAVILSHETGLCKPEKGIYELAAARLGVSCADCLFVGDGGSRELYGADAAGMTAYRAMWYIRQMPTPVREMGEFPYLESPLEVVRELLYENSARE